MFQTARLLAVIERGLLSLTSWQRLLVPFLLMVLTQSNMQSSHFYTAGWCPVAVNVVFLACSFMCASSTNILTDFPAFICTRLIFFPQK